MTVACCNHVSSIKFVEKKLSISANFRCGYLPWQAVEKGEIKFILQK